MKPEDFIRGLKGRRIRSLDRRGKYLIFQLDKGTLVGHLGMTGQLTYWRKGIKDSPVFVKHPLTGLQKTPSQHAIDKHTHLLLNLDNGDRLQYRDIRQFGHWRLFKKDEWSLHPSLKKLGLEPLGPQYTWARFQTAFAGRRGKIKALLLSQGPVAGLGNIYADEALHAAGILPMKRAENLTGPQWRALFRAIPRVLKKALSRGGTTFSDFRGADGRPGRGARVLRVYGRFGKKCFRCGAGLKKTRVSQRTTVYCPGCQK
jgi:formamidopyrimidine-DNA glycosylase